MVFDCIKKFDKLDVEICEVYSSQSFEVKFLNRVATDLENLERSGNLRQNSKSQGKVREFCVSNSFSAKLKVLILEIFWGSMPPDPTKWSRTHGRALSWSGKVREKSGNFLFSGK